MSKEVCQWAAAVLDTDINQENLKKILSNGFLIALLLHKYALLSDLSLIINSSSNEAKIRNFDRIKPALDMLGIRTTPRFIADIINMKPMIAADLLYKLYVGLKLKQKLNISLHSLKQLSLARNISADYEENSKFVQELRKLVPRDSDVILGELQKQYKQKQQEQEQFFRKEFIKEEEERNFLVQLRRQELMQRSRALHLAQSKIMADLESTQSTRPVVIRKLSQLHRDQKKAEKIISEGEAVLKHLDSFDEKLQRSEQIKRQILNLRGDEPQNGGDFETTKFEKSTDLPPEQMATSYIKEVRRRYREQLCTREAREQRRRAVLLNASRIHHMHQEEKRNHIIAEQLERRSQLEKCLATQIKQLHEEKETIIANRILRENRLKQQREENFKLIMEREQESIRQQKLEREEDARKIAERIEDERRLRRAKKYNRHLQQIRVEILLPIVDFATKIAEYREMTGRLIPLSLFRQWRLLLLNGKPLFPESHTDQEIDTTSDTVALRMNSTEIAEDREALLDEQDLQDYISILGEWKLVCKGQLRFFDYARGNELDGPDSVTDEPKPVDIKPSSSSSRNSRKLPPSVREKLQVPEDLNQNEVLQHLVDRIFLLAQPPKEEQITSLLPPVPVRGAILGKPLTGKTTIAGLLQLNAGIVAISPKDLLLDAVSLAKELEGRDSAEQNPQQIEKTPEPSSHEITAVKAYKQLAGGAEVDTDVIVDLILDKIREIPSGVGWLLDGFPSTVEHARVLEQKLSALLQRPGEVPFPTNPRISGSLPLPEQKPKFQGLDFIVVLQENDSDLIQRFLDISKDSSLSSNSESLGRDHEEGEASKVTSHMPHMDPNLSSFHAKIVNFEEEELPRIESFYRKHSDCCAFHHIFTPEGQLQPELSQRERELCLTLSNGKDLPAGCAAAYVAVYHLLEDHLKNNMEASVTEEVSEDAAKSDYSVQDQPNSHMEQAVNPVEEENKNALNADKEAGTEAPPLSGPPSDDLRKPEDVKDHSQSPPIPTIPVAYAEASDVLPTDSSNRSEADCTYSGVNLSKEVASILSNLWIQSETVYHENIRLICRLLRQQRETILRHLFDCRNDLAIFVRRPDDMQGSVTEFQMDFNQVPLKLRHDQETMAELHCRLDDLRDHLYDLADSMKAESEAKLRKRLGLNKWMPEKMTLISNLYTMMLQTELDRFQDRLRLIMDFYASARNASVTKEDAEGSALGIIDLSQAEYRRLPMLDVFPHEQTRVLEDVPESEVASSNRTGEPAAGNRPAASLRAVSNAKSVAGVTRSARATHKGGLDVGRYPLPTNVEGLVDSFHVDIPAIGKAASQEQIMGAIVTYGPGPLNAQMINQLLQGITRTKGRTPSARHSARTTATPSVASMETLLGNAAPPTDTNLKFIFDVTVCTLKILQSTLLTQQARLRTEPADGTKTTARKTKRKASRSTSRVKEYHSEISEVAGPSPEDEASRQLNAKISKEELSAITKEVEHTAFRLRLIRAMALAVLGDFNTKVADCMTVVNAWIGLRLLKSHDAINRLVALMRETIEDGKMLQGRLLLSNEEFGIADATSKKTESCLNLNFELVPVKPCERPQISSDFSLMEIHQLIGEFRRQAPTGLIAETKFVRSLTPYILCRNSPRAETVPAAESALVQVVVLEVARTYRVPQASVNNANASQIDVVDWRRFMLAVLEDNCSQQADGSAMKSLTQLDLVALAKRFCLLDQARGRKADLNRSSETLLGIQLTRSQFQFARITWWNDMAASTQMQNLLFDIFREPELSELQGILLQQDSLLASDSADPTSGPPKDKHRLLCDDLVICLSAFIATSGVEGLLMAMATLACVPLPPCCLQLFSNNAAVDECEAPTADLTIAYEVLSKLIDFAAQHTPTEEPSTDASPGECESDHDLLQSTIFQMLKEEEGETIQSSKELSLARLARTKEFQLLVSRLAPYFICPRLPNALTELLRPQGVNEVEE